jgi:methionyl-tRNA formyltransferase
LRIALIQDAASDLGLEIHEVDTFTGWQPPQDINLIVAVSFGLLIPERVLRLAKYGGLNVHPSLLPE